MVEEKFGKIEEFSYEEKSILEERNKLEKKIKRLEKNLEKTYQKYQETFDKILNKIKEYDEKETEYEKDPEELFVNIYDLVLEYNKLEKKLEKIYSKLQNLKNDPIFNNPLFIEEHIEDLIDENRKKGKSTISTFNLMRYLSKKYNFTEKEQYQWLLEKIKQFVMKNRNNFEFISGVPRQFEKGIVIPTDLVLIKYKGY